MRPPRLVPAIRTLGLVCLSISSGDRGSRSIESLGNSKTMLFFFLGCIVQGIDMFRKEMNETEEGMKRMDEWMERK